MGVNDVLVMWSVGWGVEYCWDDFEVSAEGTRGYAVFGYPVGDEVEGLRFEFVGDGEGG